MLRKWGQDKWYYNLIAFNIENPLKTWWKARKYFKIPKVRLYISTNRWYFPYASKWWQGKLLDINIHDVYWKDKYDSPRHGKNPLIYICLFGKIALWIYFTMTYKNEFEEKVDGSIYYWEYILEWLYYKEQKTLKCYSNWTSDSLLYKTIKYGEAEDGSEDVAVPLKSIIPCVAMSLNKKGIKELKRELNEERGYTQNY